MHRNKELYPPLRRRGAEKRRSHGAAQTLTRKLLAQQLGISEDGVDIKYDPGIHHRRSIRLRGYDYSRAGACFVTICTQHHECLFGDIVGGGMRLNDAGLMIQAVWDRLPIRFHQIELDEFIVMPNHVHGSMIFIRRGESCIRPDYHHESNANLGDDQSGDHIKGDHKDRPYGDLPATDNYTDRPHGTLPDTVGRIIQAFKSITTHKYAIGVKQSGWPSFPGKLWQRNYWEHIIRNEAELNRIREYIRKNPAQWKSDKLFVRANLIVI